MVKKGKEVNESKEVREGKETGGKGKVDQEDVTLTPVPLGNSGLHVAPLSLGTVKLGRDQQVKYPDPVTIPDDRAARRLLNHARTLGINLLDTAPAYGHSEERLGRLLKSVAGDWLICTKVGEEFSDGQSSYNFSPEHCCYSVERSLRRLQIDVLDIVLIHSDGRDQDILERYGTLEALLELKRAGKIRAAGISHKTVAGAERALEKGADVIMATLNRAQQEERPLIERAARAGCGVLIKKALVSGHGDPADLSWVAAQAGVHSIVVGTTSTAHLTANAGRIASQSPAAP